VAVIEGVHSLRCILYHVHVLYDDVLLLSCHATADVAVTSTQLSATYSTVDSEETIV
jgi:hypothetical protein